MEELYIAIMIDHDEKPRDCISLLGIGTKAECERLVLDSKRADLEFAVEQGIITEQLVELYDDKAAADAMSDEDLVRNATDSMVEQAWEMFADDRISYHVMKPGQ